MLSHYGEENVSSEVKLDVDDIIQRLLEGGSSHAIVMQYVYGI